MSEVVDFTKMKVQELKQLLKDQGLPTSGNKSDLVQRLQNAASEDHAEDDILNEGEDEEEIEEDEDSLVEEAQLTDEPELHTTEAASNEAKETHKVVPTVKKTLTAEERLQQRTEKFGLVSEEARKAKRASRFGLEADNSSTPIKTSSGELDSEKLKKRAERFGVSPTSTDDKATDTEKLKKRSERFGVTTSSELVKSDSQNKLLKRKERFGTVLSSSTNKVLSTDEIEEKKRKRAERFQSS